MENCYENKCSCGRTFYGEKLQPFCAGCYDSQVKALRAELQKAQEQEPVGVASKRFEQGNEMPYEHTICKFKASLVPDGTKLYAAPVTALPIPKQDPVTGKIDYWHMKYNELLEKTANNFDEKIIGFSEWYEKNHDSNDELTADFVARAWVDSRNLIPKQEPTGAVSGGARAFPRYLSVEARIKWKERWDKNYSANPDAMWTLFWESVSHEEAPITSPRITEQDAREIMVSLMQNKHLKFSEWLEIEGHALLDKLNNPDRVGD